MNSELKCVQKMESYSLILIRTIIEVTDSHTTGTASARPFNTQHQLAKIYDRMIRKPASLIAFHYYQMGALELPDTSWGAIR